MSKQRTDMVNFIGSLDGGTVQQKLASVLSDVALAVVDTNKDGEVTLKMKIKHIGSGPQVMINHDVAYKLPTHRGKQTENDETQTPMYVGAEGELSLVPENQRDLFDGEDNVSRLKK